MAHPLDFFKYCPHCGSSRWSIHNFKSKQCEDCGFIFYSNPSAANVAVIINEKNELLAVRRKNEPAKGTLDLPGGFTDMEETGEQGVIREVKEETGLDVERCEYLFSIPNLYHYSGMDIHTLDMFFRCHVKNTQDICAMDDAEEVLWIPLRDVNAADFGLQSIQKGVRLLLKNL